MSSALNPLEYRRYSAILQQVFMYVMFGSGIIER